MKVEKKDRILNRVLAKDMTPEELKKVSGGTISSSHTFWSADDDDSDIDY